MTVRLLEVLEAIPTDVLTLPEAANYLGYSVSGLWKVVKRGEIRFTQNGQGPIKFEKSWLDDYLTCHNVERAPGKVALASRCILCATGFASVCA